jgi:radical SAM protein with 4Fe4S-binding SPASM domain
MSAEPIREKIQVFYKKFKRLPKKDLLNRVYLGVKKGVKNTPQYIILQTVSACNLQCKHCFINDYGAEIQDGVTKIMKYDEFLRFCNRLDPIIRNASYFCFSTFEALLNKNIYRMMDHLLTMNPGIKFSLLSNAMLMTRENIEKLERYPISDLTISLDGMTKEVVEDFKNGVSFEKIIQALQLLSASRLKDKVEVTFVAHKNNIHQLPEYVDYVHRLGVNTIVVSNILTFTPKTAHLALYTPDGNKEVEEIFKLSIEKALSNGQIIKLPRMKPEVMGCQAVESFFVDINGNVAPCDFLAVSTPFTLFGDTLQNAPVIMGNVLYDDPLEIYRSERYQQFRRAHRMGKELPEVCKKCIDGYGMMCSNRLVYS